MIDLCHHRYLNLGDDRKEEAEGGKENLKSIFRV